MFDAEYELDFFRELGFGRRGCAVCGARFWSSRETDNCGEVPCSEYSFIGRSPARKRFELGEMRESILSYFERNWHERISRYPIVARWRDDVFFTQASIYDFQPWVIDGAAEPPANPLIVSQTCVRFNDLDNVGRTGRHFTMFEMIGHHAFNYPDKFVYWKDEALGYCHRYLVDEFGLKAEDIVYKEKPWMGGGNAGPSVEVITQGLELATIVFMNLRRDDGGSITLDGEMYGPMQLSVVDPGWGLERFAWLSQGATSAYEAVFGELLGDLERRISVPPKSILEAYSRLSGMMNLETPGDIALLKRRLAQKVGMGEEELFSMLAPLENVYMLCDHSRALAFLLNDGAVPSNVKEGYFSRLLVRRILKSIGLLRLDIGLTELLKRQIAQLGKDFPELGENREGILRLAEVEEERYAETLRKCRGLVQRMESELRKKGLSAWDEGRLVELYDSHGLAPEVVREFTGLSLTIPGDFYKKVAARHEEVLEKDAERTLPSTILEMPATEILYFDQDVLEFDAKVIGIEGDLVVLDKTYFYPEGGGEESDRGTIGGSPVVEVLKGGSVVVHKVESPVSFRPGDEVKCAVDPARRRGLTVHHTATHLINGAARRLLGNHVWQTGAHKSPEGARLDITHYRALSEEELEKLEDMANDIVAQDLKVTKSFIERAKAEKLYGFRLYQGGCVPGRELRVVDVAGWDVEACGGTHCDSTGEVGMVKITGMKRIQDGVVRLEYVAGEAAVRHMRELEAKLKETQKKLDEQKAEGAKPSDAERALADLLLERAQVIGPARLVSSVLDVGPDVLLKIARELTRRGWVVAVLGSTKGGARLIVARSGEPNLGKVKCGELLNAVLPLIGGTGGGKDDYAQGGGPDSEKVREAVERVTATAANSMR